MQMASLLSRDHLVTSTSAAATKGALSIATTPLDDVLVTIGQHSLGKRELRLKHIGHTRLPSVPSQNLSHRHLIQPRYLYPFRMRHQKWPVLNSFICYGELFSHTMRLPKSSKPVWFFANWKIRVSLELSSYFIANELSSARGGEISRRKT